MESVRFIERSVLQVDVFWRLYPKEITYFLPRQMEVFVLRRCPSYGISVSRGFTVHDNSAFFHQCVNTENTPYRYEIIIILRFLFVIFIFAKYFTFSDFCAFYEFILSMFLYE